MVLPPSPPSKRAALSRASSLIADGFLFVLGASLALSLVWSFLSLIGPNPAFDSMIMHEQGLHNLCYDRPAKTTFYDDPNFSYVIDKPMKGWDEKRREWLTHHPSFSSGTRSQNKILMVTGSQSSKCENPAGDHLLLRLFKNKVDYCRIHGHDIFYNNLLLHPKMTGFWAKYPLIRAAMLAHPEAEWIWWIDSDAMLTDMEFKIPLAKYRKHNLVVNGWEDLVYEKQSWTSLNAGVFLIRNCQWSMDLMHAWANMGPQSREYHKWGRIQKSTFKDKMFPESDDQSALIYLLLKERKKWGEKTFLEGDYSLSGYWLGIVDSLDDISQRYDEIESGVERLRRPHAEVMSECEWHGALREVEFLKKERRTSRYGKSRRSWRRPFVTHFTGCEPCSGEHNPMYTQDACWKGMQKALNFADNQVLRTFGFEHPDLLNSSRVSPLLFDLQA